MAVLTFDGNYYLLKCSYSEWQSIKSPGWIWSDDLRMFYTPDVRVAAGLRIYAEGEAIEKIDQVFLKHVPWRDHIPEPPEGLSLFDFQKKALPFALERNKSFLALEAGLGKTPIAAMLAAAVQGKVVYICPSFLSRNVMREFEKWAPGMPAVLSGKEEGWLHKVMVLPDSQILREDIQKRIKKFIGNEFSTLIVDEAHRFKNPEARRTKAIYGHQPKAGPPQAGICDLFQKQVWMSGTPLTAKPIDLFPLLSKVAPETIDFMNRFDYGRKFCDGHKTHFGWNFDGSSNLDDLKRRVQGHFMLRLWQRDCLPDLPPLVEETFVVSEEMSPRLRKLDRAISGAYVEALDRKKALIKLRRSEAEGDLHLASYRRELGLEMVPAAVEYIRSILDESSVNVMVFAFHKETIRKLTESLKEYSHLVLTGDVKPRHRQDIVDKFQTGNYRLLIGNYIAMGVGYTLTEASVGIFVEFDWDPAVNAQALKRMHRIGQKNSVFIRYMVFEGSLSERMMEELLNKRELTDNF